jgi:PASTA domain
VFDEQFGMSKERHHLNLYWHVSAPVSQLCNGSRKFSADLYMQYVNGNPIEGVNINVINSATAATTTVPKVIGLTEQQASAAIVAAGLYMAAPTQVTATAPPGTVLAQNSPGGTIEPAGSPVQITVSLGQTTAQKHGR